MSKCTQRGHEYQQRIDSNAPDGVVELVCIHCDDYKLQDARPISKTTPKTPWQVKEFFTDNPDEQFAYPCGHTDICGYVMNSSEARQIERGIETKCPRCGSNVDREFYFRRDQVHAVV